ncbi:MAG TPA: hypothetical protein VEO01_42345 [Pseudonocardiaceae bacterium]|nr:hypothetical protein [Pseudonocardiaceae bacterium]
MFGRRELALLAGVVGLALGSVVAAVPAYASTATISCTGWTHATYAPGLTNTAKSTSVVVDGDLNVIDEHSPTGSCLALGSSASAGERDVTAQLDVGCTQLIVETGVETINWNDGQSTSFSFSANVTRGLSNTILLETGTVTSGEFAGDSVVETFTAPTIAFLGCGTPGGVTALDFVTVIAITL